MSTEVWIKTAPDLDGVYRPVLEFDEDTSHPLDQKSAMEYAYEVLRAVAIAEYEAAIYAQLSQVMQPHLGDSEELKQTIAAVLDDLRKDRAPATWSTPLQLRPGVSAFSGEAFLHVEIKGKLVGQWSMADARDHALGVVESVHIAELDSGYWRALRSLINIEDDRARNVVQDLVNHRPAR